MVKRVMIRIGLIISLMILITGCNVPGFGGAGGAIKAQTASDLLNYFATSCGDDGLLVQKALSQTDALQTALQNLQKNDACQGIAQILPNVQDKVAKINELLLSPDTQAKLQSQEQVRWLTTGLALAQSSGDTALANQLSTALINAKLNYYQSAAAEEADKSEAQRQRMVNGLTAASNFVQQMLQMQGNLAYCMQDNPYLTLQLAASAMSISGSFLKPELGVAFMMFGQAVSQLLDYARTADIANGIYQLDSDKFDLALPCVLESISTTYCQSQEFLSLLDFGNNGNSGVKNPKNPSNENFWKDTTDPFLKDLRLISYKVPDLMAWIRRVSVGVTPNDHYSAERSANAIQDYSQMQVIGKRVQGIINETEFLIGKSSADSTAEIMRTGLKQIIVVMIYGSLNPPQGSSSSNNNEGGSTPIADTYTLTKVEYRLAQDADPPTNSNEQLPIETIDFKPAGITFSTIADRANQILTEVGQRVTDQLTAYTINNASLLLTSAKEIAQGGAWAPIDVIGDLISFLYDSEAFHQKLGTVQGDGAVAEIRKTRQILEDLATTILMWDPNKYDDKDKADVAAQDIIKDLFNKLVLIYGETYLSERIQAHIQEDVINRIVAGQVPQNIHDILWASGQDIITALLPSTQDDGQSAHQLRDGLQVAMQKSEANASAFVDVFKPALAASLKKLHDNIAKYGESADQPIGGQVNMSLLAKTCIMIYTSLPEWPKDLPQDLCKDVAYKSIYNDVPDLKFADLIAKLDKNPKMQDRFCQLRNYRRSGELMHKNAGQGYGKILMKKLGF